MADDPQLAPASLSPPTLSRSRASSTNVRTPLTICTRRASFTCLKADTVNTPDAAHPTSPPATDTPTAPAPQSPPILISDTQPALSVSVSSSHTSMLVILVSRALEILHLSSKEHAASGWSTPSSPRSSTDDEYILPLSASVSKTSFGDVLNEKPTAAHESHSWWHRAPSIHTPLLLVITLFPLSTALVLYCLSTLPISTSWPRTLKDLAQLGTELHGYSQSGRVPMAHVLGVLSVTAVWKHAWSIPGSVIWNVLAGALFSPAYATLLLTALTTLGSLCASLLAMPLGPLVTRFFPRALDLTRGALEGRADTNTGNASPWVRLSVLRLIGVVPWSGINIACGVCGVAVSDCLLGAFIGTLPWTAVTCQIGDILQTVASTPSPTPQTVSSLLTSPAILAKLVLLTFLSLAPILGRARLRALVTPAPAEPGKARESWTRRMHIRIPSRSRERARELERAIDEKQASEP